MKSLKIPALLALLFATLTPAGAQKVPEKAANGYPIYNDVSIPRPDRPTEITEEDVRLTDKYIDLYPDGIPEADQATLHKLYKFFKDDPNGQKEWRGMQGKAIRAISAWNMRKLSNRRYVYTLEQLKPLAKVYIFTGNELISDFIRGHLAKVAGMPIDFWVHSELRKLIPEKPLGYIETSYLNQALGTAITAVRRNMSPEEISTIETAWYEKGYIPALNWLEANQAFFGNFQAVIAVGGLYASQYFKDSAGWEKSFAGLKYYVENAILPDGSNYEGYGYFNYPVAVILKGCSVMSAEQITELLAGSGLAKSQRWRVSGLLLGKDAKGRPGNFRLTFGDNPSAPKMWGVTDEPVQLARIVCRDPLSAWVHETWNQATTQYIFLLQQKFPGRPVKALPPDEAKIPLMTAFQCGDCYLRSGWGDEDAVLAFKAMNGNREQQVYIHSRPEINSVQLGAFGEYLICNAASASYRSPIRFEHDLRTWRANVVQVDGKDQFYPSAFLKESGCFGYPDAKLIRNERLKDGCYLLSNEAKDAYVTPMKQATRTVRYVPKGRFYIIKDVLVPEDGAMHHFDHRFFIFNHDFKTKIEKNGDLINIFRPKAELYIAVNASTPCSFEYRDAYIHGLDGRDYDPDGPKQGKPGSAKGLQWSCDAQELTVISVLCPRAPGSAVPKILFEGDVVKVNGVKVDTAL
ncbi:MAG: hypothetical protein IJS62_09295 [Bacteroidales bacterium]|nr:hypothetical protein [Bacteroidales bacterium]